MQNKEIEENIKRLKTFLKYKEEAKCYDWIESITLQAIESLLQYIDQLESKVKDLEKENIELLEVKISTSANKKILDLEGDNLKLKTEIENKRKEYQETYKDVREELKKLKNKSNKYDSLTKKIKNKLNKEEIPLVIVGGRRNSKTLNYGIKLGRKQVLQELLEEK